MRTLRGAAEIGKVIAKWEQTIDSDPRSGNRELGTVPSSEKKWELILTHGFGEGEVKLVYLLSLSKASGPNDATEKHVLTVGEIGIIRGIGRIITEDAKTPIGPFLNSPGQETNRLDNDHYCIETVSHLLAPIGEI